MDVVAKPAPPGRHADGASLYLFVQPSGTRSWVQRLVIRGRCRELGLGTAALAKARDQSLANRMLARSGGDPLADRRCVQGVPTFTEAAQRVLEQKRGGWRGRWHAQNWIRSMGPYAFPRIGNRPVSAVNTADALEILEAARALGDGDPLVFPMRSGRAISASTLPKMLQYHRIAAVAHGFHSSFRDRAAEETDRPCEDIEASLAHVVQNKVEADYARSDPFDHWRRLRDDWANYLRTVRRHADPATVSGATEAWRSCRSVDVS